MAASLVNIALRGFWRGKNRLMAFKITKSSKKKGGNEEMACILFVRKKNVVVIEKNL